MNKISAFHLASKAIAKEQHTNKDVHKVKNHYYLIREKLIQEIKLDTLKFDTLFLIEGFKSENGLTYGTIITEDIQFSYSYFRGNFSFDESPYFPELMMKDLVQWDFSFEAEGVAEVYPEQEVFLSRVIKGKKQLLTNSIRCKMYDRLP
jgi:hypothetical protein